MHVDVLRPEVSPLEAVDGAQVPLLALRQADAVQELPAAVPVPDPHILLLQLLGARGAADEPEELLGDAAVEDLLGGEQGEGPVTEREPHLRPEQGHGPGTRPVLALVSCKTLTSRVCFTSRISETTCVYNSPDEVEVLHLLVLAHLAPLVPIGGGHAVTMAIGGGAGHTGHHGLQHKIMLR